MIKAEGEALTSVAVQVKVVMRCSLSEGICSEEGSWLTLSRYWDRALHSDNTWE